eukprot:1521633-Prymnesium_polylepis.1
MSRFQDDPCSVEPCSITLSHWLRVTCIPSSEKKATHPRSPGNGERSSAEPAGRHPRPPSANKYRSIVR